MIDRHPPLPTAMPSARKIKLVLTRPRPRNPLVAAARQRKAGAHRRSRSGERQQAEQALRRALRDKDDKA